VPSSFRVAPIAASFIAAAALPFACGGSGASGSPPTDASGENLSVPRHFEAGAGEGEAASDAPDEYVAQAPHCARAADAGPPSPFDAGGDALPDVVASPQVLNFGGPVLGTPTFVSVTFLGDSLADPLDDFIASVGCTPYWHTVATDYGVGDAIAAPAARLTEAAPSTIDDTAIRGWLASKIEKGDPQFPRPALGTVYVVWYPDGTSISLQGSTSCHDFGGYHEGGQLTDGTPFSYAVVPRCRGEDQTGLASLTLAASHELIEASTDPQPETMPAYSFPDANHIGWGLYVGAEVGDMCELDADDAYVPPGFPWVVQRIWSNRAAWAGQTPCVPADSSSYFYATAVPTDVAMLDLVGTPQPYPAVHIAVGTSGTVAVQAIGSGTSGTMQLQAIDPDVLFGRTPRLNLTLDANVAAAGATVHLTIQKLSGDPLGVEPFLLETTMNGRQTLSWGVTSD
jgi:hypothetical protein